MALYDQNWDINSYNRAYGNNNLDERFQGENEIYRNMDQNMNYRGPDPFGSFNSGVGSFYNQGPAVTQPRVPDWISSPDRPAIPERTGIMRNLWEGTKNIAGKFSPVGILNTLTRRKGADQSFGGYPGGWESRAGLFPNEVTNLQRLADQGYLAGGGKDIFGTNVVSQFGDYDKAMENQLGVFEKTMGKKGYEDLDELEKYYLDTYGDKSRLYNKLRHVRGWNQPGDVTGDVTGGDRAGGETITGRSYRPGDNTINWNPNITGTKSFHPSQGNVSTGGYQQSQGSHHPGSSTSGAVSTGKGNNPWGRAEGGRIGYQEGELVEDESMFAATPRGMMEENIEEVQGEPSREQLEAIALEIFRLPLEQLNEEQLMVVYQAAMQQEPSEEEVQFAAQEGPGEGIASLV